MFNCVLGYYRMIRPSGSLSSMPLSSSTTLGTSTNSSTTGTGSSSLINSLTDTNTSTSPAYRQSFRSKYLRSDDADKHDESTGMYLFIMK